MCRELKRIRVEELKLGQQELASKIGISQGQLSKIESGESEIRWNALKRLRTLFNININKVLDKDHPGVSHAKGNIR